MTSSTQAPPTDRPTELLDAEGAAQLLGVPASWVLSQARANRIPHIRLGRYVRFERDQIAAWWQTRRQGPGTHLGTADRST